MLNYSVELNDVVDVHFLMLLEIKKYRVNEPLEEEEGEDVALRRQNTKVRDDVLKRERTTLSKMENGAWPSNSHKIFNPVEVIVLASKHALVSVVSNPYLNETNRRRKKVELFGSKSSFYFQKRKLIL